jgi:hypothetical protein
VAAAKRLLDEEPRPDVSEPLPQSQFKHGISLTGILIHGVACGVLAPDVIADVAILEQAYTLVAGGSGHVREAAAIRARLDELPGDPPEIELPPVGGYRRGGGAKT